MAVSRVAVREPKASEAKLTSTARWSIGGGRSITKVLESYVIKTRNKAVALTFMKRPRKSHDPSEAIDTDRLRSYRAAMNELGNAEKQRIGRWANNRVQKSYLPVRRRERAMLRFRQLRTLQKFASVHANVYNHFSLERHLVDRQADKERRSAALAE